MWLATFYKHIITALDQMAKIGSWKDLKGMGSVESGISLYQKYVH